MAEQKESAGMSEEQRQFGAEEKIHRPVPIPVDVLQIIRDDSRNKRSLTTQQSPDDMSALWFAASNISLNDDGLADLIVQAIEPKLLGANVIPFWVLRRTPDRYELVLSTSSLGLKILETKSKGYRDLRTTKATAKEILTTTYEFNGRRYQEQHSSEEQIN